MKPILYVETNFFIGISKGQDEDAKSLVTEGGLDIQIVVPGVCFMEALSVLENETKQRNRFHSELDRQRAEFLRNTNSDDAKDLVRHLERSRISGEKLLEDFKGLLVVSLILLAKNSIVIQIDYPMIIQALIWRTTVIEDPTDALILSCIVSHAQEFPDVPKAFVSHNINDFGQKASIEKLDEVGIKYFKDVQKIGGLASSSNPIVTRFVLSGLV